MKIQNLRIRFLLLALTLCFSALAAMAQTTAFTYQGRFVDVTLPQPTNGTYEMQFKLFNATQNGAQIGRTQTVPTVQVVNGIFTVQLDAENSFNGADLFIEISVRPAGSQTALTTLAPTPAEVIVSGRILMSDGRGIRNVLVTMVNAGGESRTEISGAFGYFRFGNVAVGETYIFSVRAKVYTFTQPTLVRSILDDTNGVIFVANE